MCKTIIDLIPTIVFSWERREIIFDANELEKESE